MHDPGQGGRGLLAGDPGKPGADRRMDRHVCHRRAGRLDESAVRRFPASESESDHRYQALRQYVQIHIAGEYPESG